jgi:hypothetical protein
MFKGGCGRQINPIAPANISSGRQAGKSAPFHPRNPDDPRQSSNPAKLHP